MKKLLLATLIFPLFLFYLVGEAFSANMICFTEDAYVTPTNSTLGETITVFMPDNTDQSDSFCVADPNTAIFLYIEGLNDTRRFSVALVDTDNNGTYGFSHQFINSLAPGEYVVEFADQNDETTRYFVGSFTVEEPPPAQCGSILPTNSDGSECPTECPVINSNGTLACACGDPIGLGQFNSCCAVTNEIFEYACFPGDCNTTTNQCEPCGEIGGACCSVETQVAQNIPACGGTSTCVNNICQFEEGCEAFQREDLGSANYLQFSATACREFEPEEFKYYMTYIYDSDGNLVTTLSMNGGFNILSFLYTNYNPGDYVAQLVIYEQNPQGGIVTPILQEIPFTIPEEPDPIPGNEDPDPVDNTINLCETDLGENGFDTALGCIPIDSPIAIAAGAIRVGLGFAGGIALILMTIGAFMVSTSQGDPRRLQTGQGILFSAIAGLVLVALAIFVLRLLGFTVLGLF